MTPKKIVAINFAILLLGLGLWMASKWSSMEIPARFVTFLILSTGVAIAFALIILPALGDWVGALFYSAPEKVKPDKYTEAASRLAQGDYIGAVRSYRDIAKEEPLSRFPHVEIAKIQLEHLGDVDASIATIKAALSSRKWRENDAAFFMFRLCDFYHEHKGDDETAKSFLTQVMETFPDTRHSANARHRLNELEQAAQRH